MTRVLASVVVISFGLGCRKGDDASHKLGDSVTPTTKASETQRAAEIAKSKSAAAEHTKPAMTLPAGPKPKEVLGRSKASVRKLLGKAVTTESEVDEATIDGTSFRISYSGGIATKMVVRPAGFRKGRDERTLLDWLGVDYSTPNVVNGRKLD